MRPFATAMIGGLMLLAVWGRPVGAHALALFGHVAVDEQGEVVVRISDAYGALVEGQQVTAFATAPGDRPTRAVDLKEGPAGTYRGAVPSPGGERYQVTIDLVIGGDLHRLELPVTTGQARAEEMIAMAAIDPPQGFPWKRVLYFAAAAVLLLTSLVALRKKRPAMEGR